MGRLVAPPGLRDGLNPQDNLILRDRFEAPVIDPNVWSVFTDVGVILILIYILFTDVGVISIFCWTLNVI